MVVAATINEYNTVSETQSLNVANLNVGRLDASEMTPGPTNSIPVDSYSYEKWARIAFATIDNQIDNLQVWIDNVLDAQATLKANTRTATQTGYANDAFATPVITVSSVASFDMEVADPGEANLGLEQDSNLATPKTVDGQSDYLVLQYHASASHPGGSISQITMTIQYDEQ